MIEQDGDFVVVLSHLASQFLIGGQNAPEPEKSSDDSQADLRRLVAAQHS